MTSRSLDKYDRYLSTPGGYSYSDDSINYYNPEDPYYSQIEYPPDLVHLTGYGLSELDMFSDVGSTNYNGGYDRLEQSMRVILSTPVGSRFFLPSFGSRIHELVYEPNDSVFRDLLTSYIQEAISKWEPRVVLINISVSESKTPLVPVEIQYEPISRNDPQSFVYTVNQDLSDMD